MQRIFKEPRLLDKEKDKELVIYPLDSFSFAKETTIFPLGGSEIGRAAVCYPIFFARENNDIIPVALLGIKENAFVDQGGKWKKDCYIPGVVKAYPFGFAPYQDSYSMVIDGSYVDQKREGERFFDANGNFTEYGEKIVQYVQNIYADIERVKKICKSLENLLVQVKIDVKKENSQEYKIEGVFKIDEKALKGVGKGRLYDLFQNGALDIAYAHLVSLNNLGRIAQG